MAIVGNASVLVNAITSNFGSQIRDGFRGMDRIAGASARDMSRAFNREIQNLNADRPLSRISEALRDLAPESDRTYRSFIRLVRISYGLQAGIGALTGSIGAVLSGIVAIGASAAGAIPSVVALGGALGALLVGIRVGAGAFKGIGGALQQLQRGGGGGGGGADNTQAIQDALRNLALTIERNQRRIVEANNRIREAQLRLNDAFAEAREEIQQLGFEAEDAALAERRAALELEKAREELARVQDLPPNSRIRRQAELAFQQAELDYRQARDRASDLAAEQDRLAQTGVEGTQTVIEAREQLAEAEQNLRDVVLDSARDQEEAQRRLDQARRGTAGGGGGGGIDPFKGLTQSQIDFVNFLNDEVIPTLFSLKEAAADGFLPVLEEQIRRFYQVGGFERLRVGIASVSAALAQSVTEFMDVFSMEQNLDNFSKFFEDSARILPQFGKVFGNSLRIVLTLLAAAAPVTERFVNWIDQATESYANFLDQGQRTGELTAYLQESADLAARWGGVFGDVFGSIGDIIAANVGPGSGGDILLTWLEGAFNNLNNLDSTFLDIYFRNVGQNFTEILDAFNIIVDAMLEAGANPAVGEFWRILQAGGSALQQVVRDSVNAAPLLAKIINSLFQMIAVFADAGPLNTFLETLGFLAAGASALVQALRPLLLVLGPVFAAASALGLAFSIANKVLTVTIGFLRNALAPFVALTGALLGQTASAKSLAAAQRELLLSELALEVARKKAALDAAAANAAALANIGTAKAQATANLQLAVATNAYEVAVQRAGVASVTAGNLIKVALGPVGILIAGLSVAAAGIFAIIAEQQQRMDRAVEKTTEAIKNQASATELWQSALLSVSDGATKDFLMDIENIGDGLEALIDPIGYTDKALESARKELENAGLSAEEFSEQWTNLQPTIENTTQTLGDNTRRALEAVGNSLANVAGTDLPQAQRALRDFANETGLGRNVVRELLDSSEAYRVELVAQARQMGINIENADGTVDAFRAMNFALGEGEYAVRMQTLALEEQQRQLVESATSVANIGEAYRDALSDPDKNGNATLNYQEFLRNLREQSISTFQRIADIRRLIDLGLSEDARIQLQNLGAEGDEIIDTLLAGGKAAVAEFNGAALGFSEATTTMFNELSNKFGASVSEAVSTAAVNGDIGLTALEKLNDFVLEGKEVRFNIDEWNSLPQALRDKLPKSLEANVDFNLGNLRVPARSYALIPRKNGGIIPAFANGGFFSGLGGVTGPGGPRDDRVPALLSAGEYVVNALATKRYRPLLEAINGGSPTFANRTAAQTNMGSTSVQIVVNPSPGMHERELAKMVSRELAMQLRRGTVS